MENLQSRFQSWIRDQRSRVPKLEWVQQWRWPWKTEREQRRKIQEEYERRRRQLQELCHAVKAESVSDLQDVLSCMVLSECVYKRPATEIVRVVNKFKADFGGQVVSLERVQPSLDHVSHRYLLAEAGDTLFASFIGTKQYKDVITDANILQGAIFHDDFAEVIVENETVESGEVESQNKNRESVGKPLQTKANQLKSNAKPAVHRGFFGRAKGIPALELYRLAQKKKRKLVLCGHSLGGAVAALATLAILRVVAASSPSKENEKVQVKCITFSQPPVGNAALRDYVHRKGWRHYFKTYCIPEDLVPRILSPAYFHHYNADTSEMPVDEGITSSPLTKDREGVEGSRAGKLKEAGGEQLVLGLGPVQNPLWRLSRLVPLEGVRKQINRLRGVNTEPGQISSTGSSLTSSINEVEAPPESLEIQEGSDSISLKPFSDKDNAEPDSTKGNKVAGKSAQGNGVSSGWRRMPYLPSYLSLCALNQLYILGNSSVESLSDAEYSKLTSVRSVIAELRERFQSHSMKSYRARFQRIYDMCMCGSASFLGMEQLPQFPHLQQWLGLTVAGTVELGHIVEPPVIRTATSIVPLGWTGVPGEKSSEPLKVDVCGYGLHLCTLVQAQVNGNWCSTTVESLPSAPTYSSNQGLQPDLQKMRVIIGAPLRRPPKHQMVTEPLVPGFPSIDTESVNLGIKYKMEPFREGVKRPEGLDDFVIFCTSDFVTVSKEVCIRTRRVRFVGLQGAGKTSLFNAIMSQGRQNTTISLDSMLSETSLQEGIASGVCYSDSYGVNLQELNLEAARFRDELWMGIRDLSRKTDLIVLVHNLSHYIPRYSHASPPQPALSLLLNEAKALGIPWILAITNKFSVSAHQQKAAIKSALQAYETTPRTTEVVNSCPYVIPGSAVSPQSWSATDEVNPKGKMAAQSLILAPINLVRMPFQRKDTVMPVEGVNSMCQLIHRVLQSQEEVSFQELARDRLLLEFARDQAAADARQDSEGKGSSTAAAAVGASLGAGLGLVLAVVMGAASALRKP
ncbi:hypothetical protein Syun_006120 [Stephania yunnanensis]|uniref:Fungal lipase-type domain-containing protein n=1 Tax=Stephania yunnanensis TaxID=152371 RepID=A0AAP0KZE4_9MAGN